MNTTTANGKRKGRSRGARLLSAFVWVALLASAVLWSLDKSLPTFTRKKIEDTLSSGPVAVSIDGASFNLFRGLSLKGVRVHRKGILEGPLATIGELRIGLEPTFSRPSPAWVSGIFCRDLYVAPYGNWEAFIDSLDGSGDSDLGGTLEEIFSGRDDPVSFTADNANVMTVKCRSLDFGMTFRNGIFGLRGINIVPNAVGYRESLKGQLSLDLENGRLDVSLSGTITPSVIRDLTLSLDGDVAVEYYDAISNIQTPFSVVGEVLLCDSEAEGEITDVRLTLSGNDFAYRGFQVQGLKMGLQWLTDSRNEGDTGRRLVISPLDANFADGKFSGRLAWYPRTHATDLQAKSALPLKQLFSVIDMPMPAFATNVVLATPPHADVSGRVFPSGFEGDWFSGRVSAARATLRGLPFDDVSFQWGYDEVQSSVWVHDLAATCGGGKIAAKFDASLEGDEPFSCALTATEVKSDPIRRLIDPDAPDSDGYGSLDVALTGNLATNTLSSLTGQVTAEIRNSAITRIPLFAGLTDFIARNVVGVDLLVMQSDSDLSMSITNGLATIERLTVDGNMMSLVSRGKWRLDAPDMPVEGVAQVRFFHSRSLMGYLARIVTLPVSKLMEFRVYGPLQGPKWDYIGLIDRIAEATFWPRKDATEKGMKNQGEGEESR